MQVDKPSTSTGPFIAILFVLILLPLLFAAYSFYNTFRGRRLQRDRRWLSAYIESQPKPVRPKLWETWTELARSEQSYDDLEAWSNIQPLCAKIEPISETITNATAGGGTSEMTSRGGSSGLERIGQGLRVSSQVRSRCGTLWRRYFGAPPLPHPVHAPVVKPFTSAPEGATPANTKGIDIKESQDVYEFELHMAIIIALPSPPSRTRRRTRHDNGQDDLEDAGYSTDYCIGTSSHPIRMDACYVPP